MQGWWGRRIAATVLALAVGFGLPMPAAHAVAGPVAGTRPWPVTPAALGSLYGSADPGGLASVRVWGSAIWCYVQPTPDASVAANLDRLLSPMLDPLAAVGGGTAIVTIGHPAP